MIRFSINCMVLTFFLLLCSCNTPNETKKSFSPYSEKEIAGINEKIIESFHFYYTDIEKNMPFTTAQAALYLAVENKNIYEIDRALFYHADINYLYLGFMSTSYTVLITAISNGYESKDKEYFSIFLHLIDCGAITENIGNIKSSALMDAASCQNKEVFDYLLQKKVDINYKDIFNDNALMYAVDTSSIYFVEKLLKLGIEVNLRSKDDRGMSFGWTCLDDAIFNAETFNKNPEFVDLLRKYGAKTGAELDAEEGK